MFIHKSLEYKEEYNNKISMAVGGCSSTSTGSASYYRDEMDRLEAEDNRLNTEERWLVEMKENELIANRKTELSYPDLSFLDSSFDDLSSIGFDVSSGDQWVLPVARNQPKTNLPHIDRSGQIKNDERDHLRVNSDFTLVPTGDESMYFSKYSEGRILGWGGFGTVVEATLRGSKAKTPKRYAVKRINMTRVQREKSPGDVQRMRQEIQLLKILDHPNIVKVYEVYESTKYLWVVMELCKGGDLIAPFGSEKAAASGIEYEKKVSRCFRQVFSALRYLHARNIAHRDVKPENFIWTEPLGDNNEPQLKLLDFGLANFNQFDSTTGIPSLRTRAGSPFFVAPEIVAYAPDTPYSPVCDMWSAGVMLYLALKHELPFRGTTEGQTMLMVLKKELEWNTLIDGETSSIAIDLLKNLLERDPTCRISAADALAHPWIASSASQNTPCISFPEAKQILKGFVRYHAAPELKKLALINIARYSDDERVKKLQSIYFQLDSNANGRLNADDVESALRRALQPKQLEDHVQVPYLRQVLKSLVHKNGYIECSHFVGAALCRRMTLQADNLEQTFAKLAAVNTTPGTQEIPLQKRIIKVSDLQRFVNRVGPNYTLAVNSQALNNMIKDATASGATHLSFDDFCRMMKDPYITQAKDQYLRCAEEESIDDPYNLDPRYDEKIINKKRMSTTMMEIFADSLATASQIPDINATESPKYMSGHIKRLNPSGNRESHLGKESFSFLMATPTLPRSAMPEMTAPSAQKQQKRSSQEPSPGKPKVLDQKARMTDFKNLLSTQKKKKRIGGI